MDKTENTKREVESGDYVLATEYEAGSPDEDWAVGHYSHAARAWRGELIHHLAEDLDDFPERGFRRVEKIEVQVGNWLLEHIDELINSGKVLWEVAHLPYEQLQALYPENKETPSEVVRTPQHEDIIDLGRKVAAQEKEISALKQQLQKLESAFTYNTTRLG